MKKVLTISERGTLAEQLKSTDNFYKDLKLFNEMFPGSKLGVQLVKVNEHNIASLHGRMLYELLSKVSEEDVQANRGVKAAVKETKVPAKNKAPKGAKKPSTAKAAKQPNAAKEVKQPNAVAEVKQPKTKVVKPVVVTEDAEKKSEADNKSSL